MPSNSKDYSKEYYIKNQEKWKADGYAQTRAQPTVCQICNQIVQLKSLARHNKSHKHADNSMRKQCAMILAAAERLYPEI